MDILNILTKATSLTPEQVRSLLGTPSTSRSYLSIGEALTEKEIANADDLVMVSCKEMSQDFIKDIPVNDIPVDLVRDLPINYAKIPLCLALQGRGRANHCV